MSEPAGTPVLSISVVYAQPERQELLRLTVPDGTTVAQVVSLAQDAGHFSQAEIAGFAVFGQAVKPEQAVSEGDRIEILRPLLIDPKESRRRAAARSKR
jgi:putative ubiquitin-RnfH superfamily antitoxin RatB of RatAB toxin-antitoxin module